MESTEQHLHNFHNPDNPHPKSEERVRLEEFFKSNNVEFSPIAEQYMSLENERLQEIVDECNQKLAQNERYLEKLQNSDYSESEKEEHIYQAKRGASYFARRKQVAELILRSKE